MKRKETVTIKTIYSPYESAGKSLNEQTDAYLKDKSAIVEIDGLIYYRAVQIDHFTRGNKTSLIVFLDNKIKLCINDMLTDENDKQYRVLGFPMFSYTAEARWYKAIHGVILTGDCENVGHYYAKLPLRNMNPGE